MASKPILFFISHGHGDGADKGAVSGKFVELELTKKVAAACYAQLLETPASKRNWKVDYSERKVNGYSLAEQQKKVERYQDKYRTVCVDIHFNAGHGDGAEVWVTATNGTRKTMGTQLAGYVLDEFKKIGQNSRGVKYSNDLYVLTHPNKGISVIVECGFLDNAVDRKLFDTDKKLKKMGVAIANALETYGKKNG